MNRMVALCLTFTVIPLVLTHSLRESINSYSKNVENPTTRLIEGQEAVPHSFPYQVALFITVAGQNEKMFCGGSLLNNIYVLTAAHCVDGVSEVEVILGAHDVHNNQELSQKRFVSKVFIINKGWNPSSLTDDIALVRLPRAVEFTDEIQPVQLPKLSDQENSFILKSATVPGWGKTATNATAINSVLLYIESKVTPHFICKIMFLGKIGENQICLGGFTLKSVCEGDSGGPMVIYNDDGKPVQQGVVSYGIGFGCEKKWPQVFTKVSKYLKWIYEHTGIPIEE